MRRARSPRYSTLAGVGLLAVTAALAAPARAGDDEDVKVVAHAVRGDVHMLEGNGGNVGVVLAEDEVLLVDAQYAPMGPKLRAAVKELSDAPIRTVLNTHWHGDHTGGNEGMVEAGARVVAHDGVRARMATEQSIPFLQRVVPPSPPAALPSVTFDTTVTLHVGSTAVEVVHAPHAHTDGDSIVWVEAHDVVHMGDTFFHGIYPFVDLDSGGSVEGVIAAVDAALAKIGDDTVIIPGHGPLAGRDDLVAYRAMLVESRAAVKAAMAGGETLADVVAARPTAATDEAWGGGFISPEAWVTILYRDLGGEG